MLVHAFAASGVHYHCSVLFESPKTVTNRVYSEFKFCCMFDHEYTKVWHRFASCNEVRPASAGHNRLHSVPDCCDYMWSSSWHWSRLFFWIVCSSAVLFSGLDLATITFINFVASIFTLILKQPLLLPLPSSTQSLITAVLFTCQNPKNPPIADPELAHVVVKARKFCHITPILCSFHWLEKTECIEYRLLSLTYKVLTTTKPSYLHHLITVQPPCSTCSS